LHAHHHHPGVTRSAPWCVRAQVSTFRLDYPPDLVTALSQLAAWGMKSAEGELAAMV
jgi:hypothetical protein